MRGGIELPLLTPKTLSNWMMKKDNNVVVLALWVGGFLTRRQAQLARTARLRALDDSPQLGGHNEKRVESMVSVVGGEFQKFRSIWMMSLLRSRA